MEFLIRADASVYIGSGHVMRCITLAHALQRRGHRSTFVMRAHDGHLADFVRAQGFDCVLLPHHPDAAQEAAGEPRLAHSAWLGCTQAQDVADCLPHIRALSPDWIICDHYALSDIWQRAVRAVCGSNIMVLDDLHDRTHDADVLLDQNYGHTAADYAGCLPSDCHVLAGTQYALLREEFARWRAAALNKPQKSAGCLQNVLVNLGGVDKDNHTLALLQRLAESSLHPWSVTVVMGNTAPHTDSIRAFAQHAPFDCRVLVGASNMAELMAQADWAVGAAGGTSWERCALGLPTLLLVIADNQRSIAEQLQAAGAARFLPIERLHGDEWRQALDWFGQPAHRAQMAEKAAALCDGLGAARVADYLSAYPNAGCIAPAVAEDCRLLFEWRNHADIRRFMFNPQPLVWAEHAAWFARQLDNPDFKMLVYRENGRPKGYVSFKKQPAPDDTWEWGFYAAPDAERGTGSRMGQLALAWAFEHLGARQVVGRVLPHNAASLKMHEKLGFVRQEDGQGGSVEFVLQKVQAAGRAESQS